MTRETKLGLVVSSSFVILLGGLIARKVVQEEPASGTTTNADVVAVVAETTPKDSVGRDSSTSTQNPVVPVIKTSFTPSAAKKTVQRRSLPPKTQAPKIVSAENPHRPTPSNNDVNNVQTSEGYASEGLSSKQATAFEQPAELRLVNGEVGSTKEQSTSPEQRGNARDFEDIKGRGIEVALGPQELPPPPAPVAKKKPQSSPTAPTNADPLPSPVMPDPPPAIPDNPPSGGGTMPGPPVPPQSGQIREPQPPVPPIGGPDTAGLPPIPGEATSINKAEIPAAPILPLDGQVKAGEELRSTNNNANSPNGSAPLGTDAPGSRQSGAFWGKEIKAKQIGEPNAPPAPIIASTNTRPSPFPENQNPETNPSAGSPPIPSPPGSDRGSARQPGIEITPPGSTTPSFPPSGNPPPAPPPSVSSLEEAKRVGISKLNDVGSPNEQELLKRLADNKRKADALESNKPKGPQFDTDSSNGRISANPAVPDVPAPPLPAGGTVRGDPSVPPPLGPVSAPVKGDGSVPPSRSTAGDPRPGPSGNNNAVGINTFPPPKKKQNAENPSTPSESTSSVPRLPGNTGLADPTPRQPSPIKPAKTNAERSTLGTNPTNMTLPRSDAPMIPGVTIGSRPEVSQSENQPRVNTPAAPVDRQIPVRPINPNAPAIGAEPNKLPRGVEIPPAGGNSKLQRTSGHLEGSTIRNTMPGPASKMRGQNPERGSGSNLEVKMGPEATIYSVPREGRTWQEISRDHYNDPHFAESLREYNANAWRRRDALQWVKVPGGTKVEIPDVRQLTRSIPVVSQTPEPTRGTPPRNVDPPGTYRVRKQGMFLWKIAQDALGDGRRWSEIYRLNPQIQPELPIQINTVLQMPLSAYKR
ncbi:MAG: hypothetical protein ACFCD0_21980 [Gemmataceae bacterium]